MRWAMLASGLGAFAAALIALAPATLVDARLARASDGRLRLASAQGSLWSGTGWLEIRDAEGRAGVAQPIAWRLLPRSLLRARLVAEVELGPAARPFPVTISLSQIEIAHAGIQLPAAALGLGMPRLAPYRLTGELLLNIPHLSVERGRMDGEATLQWRAAGSALAPLSPLGEYEVHFKAAGPAVHAALRTIAGPLELEGKGSWSNGTPPDFFATAHVPLQHQERLVPLLRLFALDRGAGTFELQLK